MVQKISAAGEDESFNQAVIKRDITEWQQRRWFGLLPHPRCSDICLHRGLETLKYWNQRAGSGRTSCCYQPILFISRYKNIRRNILKH